MKKKHDYGINMFGKLSRSAEGRSLLKTIDTYLDIY